MSLISVILPYYIGDSLLLIVVCPSLALVHSLSIGGVVYCSMLLICSLPALTPVKVVLFWLVTDGIAIEIYYFPLCPSI